MTDRNHLIAVESRPLPNGSMLYVLPHTLSPLALIQAVVRTGSIHEAEYTGCGISHFLEHMLFQGCERYPGSGAADRIHALGGSCNAYTAFDHTAFYAELPAEKLADAIDILSSMISAPLFPEEKFVSEKAVIAREAEMIFDRPEQVLVQNLWQQVFTVHPARFPIVGFPDKIAGVDRGMMKNYYCRRYGAMRTHWLISGPVDPDETAALLAEKLADYPRGDLSEPVLSPEPEQRSERRMQTDFADAVSRIALGIRMPEATHRDIPALDILTGIIGQNSSSRLVRKLYQEEELAVSLSSAGYVAAFAGVMGVNAACDPAKLGALERRIRELLDEVRRDGVTEAELEREKLQQRTLFYRTLESPREMLSIVNDGIINYGDPAHAGSYLARLEAVTLDEVNRTAAVYFTPERFSWSLLHAGKNAAKPARRPPRTVPAAPPVHRLASGAECVLMARGPVPLNTLVAVLPAGAIWESARNNGVSALLAEMLTGGPEEWSESDFYDLLDNNGMELSVSAGNNTFTVTLNYPAETQRTAETIFLKLLSRPRRDKSFFAREKGNLADQLASRLMQVRPAAMQAARRALFGSHPAGLSRFGTPESLEVLTVEEVQKFYAERFDPAWVKFGASCGRSDAARCEKFFAKLDRVLPWRDTKLPVPHRWTPPEGAAWDGTPHLVTLDREQSAVVYALSGCSAASPDHVVMEILDSALNGLSSRIFREIREKRSLAYATGASITFGLVSGMTALFAGTKPERASEALEALAQEADRLAEEGLDKAEFEAAKLNAVAGCAHRLEQSSSRLLSVLLSLFYGEKAEEGLNMAERIGKMRYGEFNRALKRCFSRAARTAVIAGPEVPEKSRPAAPEKRKRSRTEQPELPLYRQIVTDQSKKSR